jgi:hypothetical protein
MLKKNEKLYFLVFTILVYQCFTTPFDEKKNWQTPNADEYGM